MQKLMRRKTPITSDYCYHIYNRGNQKDRIFFERENYIFFLRNWRKYFENSVDIFCYCLMPNHYHFLIKPLDDKFSIKMRNFTISYSKAINKRFDRVGHLFQGNFKAKLVRDNNVILHLTRYIHLNPVDAKLVSKPGDWEFSSYREFVKLRDGSLVKPEFVLEQFKDYNEYKEFVESVQDFNIDKEYLIEN